MLKIGLDYDGTYTSSPKEFLQFAKSMREAGHKVYVVTMRYPSEAKDIDPELLANVDGVFATSREAKQPFMTAQGIDIHIWIDDNPTAVHMSAKQIWGTASPEGMVIDPIHN